MVEYDAASTETHWLCAAPTIAIEYDAYAARAVPSPLVDGPVVKVVHVPQVQVVEKTNEIPQLQTIEKIVDIPEIQTLEAVLHEFDDEELCCDDLEEIGYIIRMNRKRLWRRVWHGCSSPSDASKSERSWRRHSKCLCYEDEFHEMKRTCAFARGQTVVCVQLTMNSLDCSTDAVRLLWATQEVHTGRIVHGALLQSKPGTSTSQMTFLPRSMST